MLVQARLRGDPDDAAEQSEPVRQAVGAVARDHGGVKLQQAGVGSFDHAIEELVAEDLQKAELISLPITLLILLLAFGAVVAAVVPLVLGITAVTAAMGALGVVSQIAPEHRFDGVGRRPDRARRRASTTRSSTSAASARSGARVAARTRRSTPPRRRSGERSSSPG